MAERWDKGRSVNHIEGIENIVVESGRERKGMLHCMPSRGVKAKILSSIGIGIRCGTEITLEEVYLCCSEIERK